MTLSTTASRVNYPGAGSTGPFAFPFKIHDEDDLLLVKRSATGVETILTLTTDYSVAGVLTATGTVTLVVALAVGETLAIVRAASLTQDTSIRNGGPYFAANVEDAFDRMAMQLQSLQDELDRSFGVSDSWDPADLTLRLVPETGKVLGWDSSTLLTNKTLDSSAVALPGSGRTVATLSAYLANNALYNAKDWGALGNGSADDTAELTAWMAAIPSGADGFLPDGNYKVNGEITGADDDVQFRSAGATITQTGANKRTFLFENLSGISVRGIQFVGKGTEHVGGSTSYNHVAAVYFLDCTEATIEACTATNHAGGAFRWGGSMDGLLVNGNRIDGIGTAGGIATGDNNDDVAIGSYSSLSDNNIVITNNEISGHCFGIYFARGSGAVVAGNTIHDIVGQHGIYLSQMSSVVIEGNTVRNIAYIGMKDQISGDNLSASKVLISGNQVTGCGQSGIDVEVTSVSVNSYFERVLIIGNLVTDCATTYGIATDGVRKCTIANNYIIATGAYGIFFNNSYGAIKGNDVDSANWNPIFAVITHQTDISGNTIVDGVLNAEAGAINNRYLYLIFVTVSLAFLVANPVALIDRNTYSYTVTVPTHFAASGKVVRCANGVITYIGFGERNLTARPHEVTTAGNLRMRGTVTYDPANLVDGAGVTTTVTATGASLGDFALASFSLDLQSITLTAWVSAADTVSVRFQNESGGAIDLASGTIRVAVMKALF